MEDEASLSTVPFEESLVPAGGAGNIAEGITYLLGLRHKGQDFFDLEPHTAGDSPESELSLSLLL